MWKRGLSESVEILERIIETQYPGYDLTSVEVKFYFIFKKRTCTIRYLGTYGTK